MITNLRN